MQKETAYVNELLRDLIPTFMEGRQKELVEIKEAMRVQDYDALAKIGHRLKGTSLNYGFNGLGEIAKKLETAGKSHNMPSIESLVKDIEEYLKNVSIIFIADDD